MTYKWQRHSSLQTRILTSTNNKFQESWITGFPQGCKTVSVLRYFVNKQNIKNINSHKQKNDHHQNSLILLLHYASFQG